MTGFLSRGARSVGVSIALVSVGSIVLVASLRVARSSPDPLSHTLPSAEAVSRMVLDSMRAGDFEQLRALALTRSEFETLVWPHLPASRAGRNVPLDFVWNLLQQNSSGYLRQTVATLPDDPLELQQVRFAGEASRYGNVTVHRDAELVVTDREGTARTVRLFGSLIEQNGSWKVFSYVVD